MSSLSTRIARWHLAAMVVRSPTLRRQIEGALRREEAELRLVCVTPPARLDVVMAELDRREEIYEATLRSTPAPWFDPRLAALESVYGDVVQGRL